MSGKLLIVESPTKARTISRMLGGDYVTMASMGHVRDLPEHSFGVDVEHDFAPVYEDTPRSRKVVGELRAAARKADAVYLATDPDREGEAIAWHLKELLSKSCKGPFLRVSFHEITRSAIEKALAGGGDIDLDLVDAQQARRVLDRVVGYKVSPLLWSQIAKGASAGRVQSVALRLIVEREREIQAFKPEEYWDFELDFVAGTGAEFTARLIKIDGGDFRIDSAEAAEKVRAAMEKAAGYRIAAVTRSRKRRNPYPPFTTSTMQQAANRQLRMSATGAMRAAQALYEGFDLGAGGATGLITYMRTDSVNIAREARDAAREFIAARYGREYVPDRPNLYRSKSLAQEAHEAIRPTDVARTPESLKDILPAAELKLYTLIWRRFVASQMTPAEVDTLAIDVDASGADGRQYRARCNASAVVFKGCTVVYADDEKIADAGRNMAELGQIAEGGDCLLKKIAPQQKFTEPPPRYTEASLIKELEENGVGRPSTYASIIRTIETRKYVSHAKTQLLPTELGFRVCDFLVATLPELFNVEFTRRMEGELDQVEEGRMNWTGMMKNFYGSFSGWLDKARMHGAPEKESAEKLLALFGQVKFPEDGGPSSSGRRAPRSDRAFVESLRETFRSRGGLSARQYSALCKIASRYAGQVPALAEFASGTGGEEKTGADEKTTDWSPVFEALAKVEFEPPAEKGRGRRSFDDREFFNSFRRQYENGRQLSEKQLGVLRRIVGKYSEQIPEASALTALFDRASGAAATSEAVPGTAGPGTTAPSEDCSAEFSLLSGVSEWAEPVKRGRRVYDDKTFFQSLVRQRDEGKKLSEKQVAALKKLAARYRDKVSPGAR